MKKIFYYASALILMPFIGCQNEEDVFDNTSKQENIIVTASVEDGSESRTIHADDGVTVLWQENDELSVFLAIKEGQNKRFFLIDGAGQTSASFQSDEGQIIVGGTGGANYTWSNVAYYPYNEDVTINKNNDVYELGVVLPTAQNYETASFGKNTFPMVAVTEGKGDFEFKFKNVAALIGLKLKGNATITKVVLESKSLPLAGSATVKAANGVDPILEMDDENVNYSILLDCGEEGVALNGDTPTKFTFTIPPGTYPKETLTFKAYDNNGNYQEYLITSQLVLARKDNKATIKSFDNPQKVVKVKLNGAGSYATIEEAIAAITYATQTNTISLYDGIYTLPEITNQNIVFEPQGECDVVKINMSETSHIDEKFKGSNLTFKNIVLTGGTYNGKYNGYVQSVSETYNECTFEDYYMFAGDKVVVTDCTFNGIEGSYFWTGSAGELAFTNCKFNGVDRALKVLSVGNAQEIARKVTFTNCQFTSTISNKAVLEFDSSLANSPFEVTVTGCTKSDVFPAWYSDKKDSDNYILTIDGIQVYPGYAKVDDTYEIYSPKGLVYAATNLFPNGGTFNITADIDMTDVEYPSVDYNKDEEFIIKGNNNTIKGMSMPLINSTWSAEKLVKIQDLTLENPAVALDEEDTKETTAVGAFIASPNASAKIELNNCHVLGGSVKGGHWTGGLVGWAGGYNGTDGPVFETLTIVDCSVKNCTIEGKGSVGGIIGHAANGAWTLVDMDDITVSGNTITSTGDSAVKAGSVMGTVGAAQTYTVNGITHDGYVSVDNATIENNIVTSNGTAIDRIYGRQGSTGGVLYIDGVQVIFDAAQLAANLTADKTTIEVILANNIDLPITSLGSITAGSGEYKLGGESTQTINIDLNGQKLNITTGYWSAIGAKNDNATITIKNGTMTSTGNSAGTWNAWDVRFCNCNYMIENVTFEKAVALDNAGKSATLKGVTIKDNHNTDTYALWITAEGQNVTLDNCVINMLECTDGRGIKIDDQYVSDCNWEKSEHNCKKVVLTVSNTTFSTEEKSAILVKSAAGADITLSNVNINNVAADNVNAVWCDADAVQYTNLINVSGGTKIDEN